MADAKAGRHKEESKDQIKLTDSEGNSDDPVAKVLFGHEAIITGLLKTADQKHLVTVDRLNKIRVSGFPNVFAPKDVLLEHGKTIRDCIVSAEGDGWAVTSIDADGFLSNSTNGDRRDMEQFVGCQALLKLKDFSVVPVVETDDAFLVGDHKVPKEAGKEYFICEDCILAADKDSNYKTGFEVVFG